MSEYARLQVAIKGEVCICRFVDQRLFGDLSVQAIRELEDLVNQGGHRVLLLNLSSVVHISSEMLAKLIVLSRDLAKKGGKLCLFEVPADLRQLFTVTRLDRVFDIRDTEGDALAGLQ
jgi:anti-sigma B factor antagonist